MTGDYFRPPSAAAPNAHPQRPELNASFLPMDCSSSTSSLTPARRSKRQPSNLARHVYVPREVAVRPPRSGEAPAALSLVGPGLCTSCYRAFAITRVRRPIPSLSLVCQSDRHPFYRRPTGTLPDLPRGQGQTRHLRPVREAPVLERCAEREERQEPPIAVTIQEGAGRRSAKSF